MTFDNHIILGDGSPARLVQVTTWLRMRDGDGHFSCNHDQRTDCGRYGHETVRLYEVEPLTWDEFDGDPFVREKWDALTERAEKAEAALKAATKERKP